MTDNLTATAPERIWLQVNPEAAPDDQPFPKDTEGVTWCSHSIGGQEVEYVRATKSAAPDRPPTPEELAARLVALAAAMFDIGAEMQYIGGFNGKMVDRGEELCGAAEIAREWARCVTEGDAQ